MKSLPFAFVAGVTMACNFAQAATPAELLAQYQLDAAKAAPGFTPSAQRGGAFYANRFSRTAADGRRSEVFTRSASAFTYG